MELSYSSLTLPQTRHLSRLQTVIRTRKSCNLRKVCSPIHPSLRLSSYSIGRANSKNIKFNSIRACTQTGSRPITVTKKLYDFGDALWRFLRPYTIKGTAIASSCLLARALIETPNLIEPSLVFKALSGLFALACVNSYTAGINQIYDIEIDKINKPYLPIAGGDLSIESAWLLVMFFGAAGLSVVGLTCGPLVTFLYCVALFLATAYSVPPLRFKGCPLKTLLTIAITRGFLLNIGVYYSTRITLGLAFQWSVPLAFIITFGTVIGLVIGITKDLSDVEGDSKFEVPTLATKFGLRNVAYLGSGLLLSLYAAAILAAICMPQTFRRSVMIPAHSILALSLIYQTRVLEQANYNREASLKFYMFIWNLYYAEYIIFPFM